MILRSNTLKNLNEEQKDALEQVFDFAHKNNLDLFYASFFGSKLYGTNNEFSDLDIKGVFLPTKNSLLLEQAPNCFTFKSNNTNAKNTSEDKDIEFYSLHNFLKMVARGDTGALDLLFSYTNKDAVLYISGDWKSKIFPVIDKLFNPLNIRAFIGYAIGQASKYSLKGERLEALEKVIQFIGKYNDYDRLSDHLDEIIEYCSHGTFVKEDFTSVRAGQECNIRGLRVLGKMHMGTVFMIEVKNRLNELYKKYGHRAQQAKESDGTDWKAMSHALRVTYQAKELLTTGKITFPLEFAQEIKDIKEGKVSKQEFENLLDTGIENVDNLIKTTEIKNQFDQNIVNKLILSMYS